MFSLSEARKHPVLSVIIVILNGVAPFGLIGLGVSCRPGQRRDLRDNVLAGVLAGTLLIHLLLVGTGAALT